MSTDTQRPLSLYEKFDLVLGIVSVRTSPTHPPTPPNSRSIKTLPFPEPLDNDPIVGRSIQGNASPFCHAIRTNTYILNHPTPPDPLQQHQNPGALALSRAGHRTHRVRPCRVPRPSADGLEVVVGAERVCFPLLRSVHFWGRAFTRIRLGSGVETRTTQRAVEDV